VAVGLAVLEAEVAFALGRGVGLDMLITGGIGCGRGTGADSAIWRPEVNDPANGEIGEHLRVGAGKAGR